MTERLPDDIEERLARTERLEEAATELFIAVWWGLHRGQIPDRSRIDDAALRLRDVLNPNWPQDSNWLPDEIRNELA